MAFFINTLRSYGCHRARHRGLARTAREVRGPTPVYFAVENEPAPS